MADTRTRIITATNELFRRQGYHGTSLSQISLASAATIGSIYHFFPGGKSELTAAVIESTAAAYRELFESIVGAAADPVSGFADFFDGGAAILEESGFLDPCPIGTIAREVASTDEELRRAAASAFSSWTDAGERIFARAGVPADEAADLAIFVVAAIEGAFILSRTHRSAEMFEAVGRRIVLVVAAAMAGPRSRA